MIIEVVCMYDVCTRAHRLPVQSERKYMNVKRNMKQLDWCIVRSGSRRDIVKAEFES